MSEKDDEIKRLESELYNISQNFYCDIRLLERAIKGEEQQIVKGKLTIELCENRGKWLCDKLYEKIKQKDEKDILVFNLLLKGHDEKHTI